MKWIVGLDLRPRSQGAVQWSSWLAANSRAADHERFLGIHVLEDDHLRAVLRYHHLDEIAAAARDSARRMVVEEGATAVLGEIDVIQGLTADRSLEAARVYHHADGLVIGRQANRQSHAIVRLGRVARRVLRSLSSPVVVVPPDLRAADIGDGPIVAMTSLGPDSVPACRFAARMAQRTARKLVVIHAVPLPEDYGVQYIPGASLEQIRDDHRKQGEADMAKWIAAEAVRPDSTAVLAGQPVPQAIAFADERRAALVVCGSRHLGNFERVLLTSNGSELAAVAPLPVAIVPPS